MASELGVGVREAVSAHMFLINATRGKLHVSLNASLDAAVTEAMAAKSGTLTRSFPYNNNNNNNVHL